jgi:hypothetical protein
MLATNVNEEVSFLYANVSTRFTLTAVLLCNKMYPFCPSALFSNDINVSVSACTCPLSLCSLDYC